MSNDTSDIPILSPSQVYQPEHIQRLSAPAPYVNPEVTKCLIDKNVPAEIAPIVAKQGFNNCEDALEIYKKYSSSDGKGFVAEAAKWWPPGNLDIKGGGKLNRRNKKNKSKNFKIRKSFNKNKSRKKVKTKKRRKVKSRNKYRKNKKNKNIFKTIKIN